MRPARRARAAVVHGARQAAGRLALRAGRRLVGRDGLARIVARRALERLLDVLEEFAEPDAASAEGRERIARALRRARLSLELLTSLLRERGRDDVRGLVSGVLVVERAIAAAAPDAAPDGVAEPSTRTPARSRGSALPGSGGRC
ncbi:MAG: hypothetical protein D6738_09030 [Acidobacteria bacterium]|nr:MAG: hypothetical protein D6738_09030 [Acidobacteriota bacterium]